MSRTDVETFRFTLESEKKKGAISETKNGLAFVSNSEPFSRHALFVVEACSGFGFAFVTKNGRATDP